MSCILKLSSIILPSLKSIAKIGTTRKLPVYIEFTIVVTGRLISAFAKKVTEFWGSLGVIRGDVGFED